MAPRKTGSLLFSAGRAGPLSVMVGSGWATAGSASGARGAVTSGGGVGVGARRGHQYQVAALPKSTTAINTGMALLDMRVSLVSALVRAYDFIPQRN